MLFTMSNTMSKSVLIKINIIIYCVLLVSCISNKENLEFNSDDIVLVKTDSLVLENTNPMFGKIIEKFRVSKTEDLLVFTDRLQDKVFVFDNRGEFVNIIGERGKGPKGIVTADHFAINDSNQVLIYDSAQYLL